MKMCEILFRKTLSTNSTTRAYSPWNNVVTLESPQSSIPSPCMYEAQRHLSVCVCVCVCACISVCVCVCMRSFSQFFFSSLVSLPITQTDTHTHTHTHTHTPLLLS